MAVERLLRPPILLCILLLIPILQPPDTIMAAAQPSSGPLLRLKNSFVDSDRHLDTWDPRFEPCNKNGTWVGLVCYNGVITGIQLENMNLSGAIDIDALLEVQSVKTVSFVGNAFSGSIPRFNRMVALTALSLSENNFSGEIPMTFFEKMRFLKNVSLSHNKFTGPIPASVSQLPQLVELRLENNRFDGVIPLINVPTLIYFNVSNNDLGGEIPAALLGFDASSFRGNPRLCKEYPSLHCTNKDANETHSPKFIITIMLIIGVVVIAILFIIRLKRKALATMPEVDFNSPVTGRPPSSVNKSLSGSNVMNSVVHRLGMSLSRKSSNPSVTKGELVLLDGRCGHFGMPDLMKAAAEVLGNGALGSSYKAAMPNGFTVVVKRIKAANGMEKGEFDDYIRKLAKLQHPNVAPPLAYHYRTDEKLVVYEYMPKGSLLYLLHGDRGPSHANLNWPARLKIIKGIAKGIEYLHDELSPTDLPHGNLKSSNVLLGPDNEPMLSEYGIKPMITTTLNGLQSLFAFKSPEAVQYGLISPKCDVFCLGIMILEILTGRFPSQYLSNGKGGTDVVLWVVSAITDGQEVKILDPAITQVSSPESVCEMKRLLRIGAACVESNIQVRLGIKDAVRSIHEIEASPRTMHDLPSLRDGYADSHQHFANRNGSFAFEPL